MKVNIKFKGNIKLKTPFGKIQVKEFEWNEETTPEEFKNLMKGILYCSSGNDKFVKNFVKD